MRMIPIAFLAAVLPLCAGPNDSFVLKNATVHPVSGPKIESTSVLVIDGKIAEIGPKVAAKAKMRVIDAKGLHLYPGMIDSGAPVGLSEIAAVRETNDVSEIGDFNPQLRSMIAVNPESEHIPVVRANGITSVLVTPGAVGGGGERGGSGGGIISGQAALMHLDGWTWEQMEMTPEAAMQMRWPVIQLPRGSDGDMPAFLQARRTTYAEAKQAQEEQVRKIQEFFEAARRYKIAKDFKEPNLKPDLKLEAMIPVLQGKVPLMIVAQREREIREAMQWAEKEHVKIVLADVRSPGKLVAEIAQKKIPVILGTTFATPLEEDDPYDQAYSLPGELWKAGVKIAFASFGTQFARNLPYEAAQAVPYGLPYDEALKAVTLAAAEIWGVEDRYGSIDVGKSADLIVTDGDPLEVRTQVKMLFIKGEQVDLESKHTRLYKKYLARP